MRPLRLWLLALLTASTASLGPAPAWIWATAAAAALGCAAGLSPRRRGLSGAAVLALSGALAAPTLGTAILAPRAAAWTVAGGLIGVAAVAFLGLRRATDLCHGLIGLSALGLLALAGGPLDSPWMLPALAAAIPPALGSFLARTHPRPMAAALGQGLIVAAVAALLFVLHPIPFGALHALTRRLREAPAVPTSPPPRARDLSEFSLLEIHRLKGDPTELLTAHVGEGREHLPDGPALYLRTATLDTYRNGIWSSEEPMDAPVSAPDDRFRIAPVADTGAALAGEIVLTHPGYAPRRLPLPTEPTEVEGRRYRLNRHHDVIVPHDETPPTGYRFRARVTARGAEAQLAAAPADPTPSDRELYDLGATLRPIAEDWSAGRSGPYDRARAICERLARSGEFRYDARLVPVPPGNDPTVHFLTEGRRGQCREFASAAVLLLRAIDVPARLAIGLMSTEFDPKTGNFRFRARDAHAWVEIHLESYGWVRLDPTPPAPPVSLLTRAIPTPPRPLPRAEPAPPAARWDDPIRSYAATDPSGRWIGVALLALALVGLVLWLLARRRGERAVGRRARFPAPSGSTLAFFAEWLKLLRRHGWAPQPGETIERFVGRLPGRCPREPLERLTRLYNAARFGGRPSQIEAARDALAALRRALAAR
jgi:transglutaminase-like putative cysteine protease